MNQRADIVIAGAGVIGMCIAVQVARRSNRAVLVLDKGGDSGRGLDGSVIGGVSSQVQPQRIGAAGP